MTVAFSNIVAIRPRLGSQCGPCAWRAQQTPFIVGRYQHRLANSGALSPSTVCRSAQHELWHLLAALQRYLHIHVAIPAATIKQITTILEAAKTALQVWVLLLRTRLDAATDVRSCMCWRRCTLPGSWSAQWAWALYRRGTSFAGCRLLREQETMFTHPKTNVCARITRPVSVHATASHICNAGDCVRGEPVWNDGGCGMALSTAPGPQVWLMFIAHNARALHHIT